MALAAVDNLTLLEVMQSGDPGLTPGPAAKAFYHETVAAMFKNPATRGNYLNNAWQLWAPQFSNAREWSGLTDRLSVRRTQFGAMAVTVDAHGIPGAVQNNPNDPQNELRLSRYRPEYRQATISLSRDEFIPITVDPVEVGRLLAQGFESNGAAQFLANQLTQTLNTDRAREFNTLMDSWARFSSIPGVFYVHTPDLDPTTTTEPEARETAATIQGAVFNITNDFTNRFSTAKQPQTVPDSQVRLVISNRAWRAIRLGYGSSYNPEYVFALPEDQIVVLPDTYFDSRADFAGNQVQWALVDAGNDTTDGGTFLVIDSLYEQGADPFNIKQTYNQALHHASFLDLNPFKTLVQGGPGQGTAIADATLIPATITMDIYTDQGVITVTSGILPRGVEFSTNVKVLDATGSAAGGYEVTITGDTSPTGTTDMVRYSNGVIGIDELSSTITVTATSLADPTKTISHTYEVGGYPATALLSGNLIVNPITFPGVFAAGTGTGGTYTYTAATGVTYEKTLDGGTTWVALGASAVAVATGDTITVRATAAAGYEFADGTTVKTDGPYTAA